MRQQLTKVIEMSCFGLIWVWCIRKVAVTYDV